VAGTHQQGAYDDGIPLSDPMVRDDPALENRWETPGILIKINEVPGVSRLA
jgi:hypothetical protein